MASTDSKTAPKTELPNPFAAFAQHMPSMGSFDPMTAWAQGQQTFQKLMTDATSRWQAFADQYATMEQQMAKQAEQAVASWAQLAKDAIAYGQQLSAEARKLSVETAKKMGVNA